MDTDFLTSCSPSATSGMPWRASAVPNELAIIAESGPPARRAGDLPALVTRAGGPAAQAWTDFFDGKVRNHHTRRAYARAVKHFLTWCDAQGLELPRIRAGDVGRYLARLSGGAAKK